MAYVFGMCGPKFVLISFKLHSPTRFSMLFLDHYIQQNWSLDLIQLKIHYFLTIDIKKVNNVNNTSI